MKGTPQSKVLTYRWVIFWIMAIAYVFVYFHRLSPAVVALDLQNALHASGGFMGLLASAYFYPYALMQFPAGLLSDSLGPRKTVSFFLLIAGAGSFLFGLAPSVEIAVLARVLVGLGVSMVFIPAMKIFSQWFRVSEFALMAAVLNTMGGVGALTAATPLAIMTGWVGWRFSFEIIGVATFVIAILVWVSCPKSSKGYGMAIHCRTGWKRSGNRNDPCRHPSMGRRQAGCYGEILLAGRYLVFLPSGNILQLRRPVGRSVFYARVRNVQGRSWSNT